MRWHEAISFKNNLWVFGASTSSSPYSPEAWTSPDGKTWSNMSEASSLPFRYDYKLTVFQDKLWLIGGADLDYNYTNEVWSSTDGVSWTQVTANAGWPTRAFGHTVLIYNNLLWVMGGETETTESNLIGDVWYSADGANWTQATANAPWGERGYHASVVFDNKMWVMGGRYGDNWDDTNDIWYSTNGVSWTQAIGTAAWPPINSGDGLGVFTLNDELWMIGNNDVWKSSNGIDWIEIPQTMFWGGRADYATAVFSDRLWVVGGVVDGLLTTEVRSTPDRAISHYKICWDTVQGGCRNTATSPTVSYTLNQPLSPGTWYFSVIAVNGENEESVLGASTSLVVPVGVITTPANQRESLDDSAQVTDQEVITVDSPQDIDTEKGDIKKETNQEDNTQDSTDKPSNLTMVFVIIAAATATLGWLAYRLNAKRKN